MDRDALWIVVESIAGEIGEVGRQLCTEGRQLANRLDVELWAVLAGQQVASLAPDLGRFGVDRVLVAEDDRLSPYTTAPYTGFMAELVSRYGPLVLLFAATSLGRDLAPRLATRLQVGYVPHCVRISLDAEGQILLTRAVCGEQAYASYTCPDSRPVIATLRLAAVVVEELDTWRPPQVEQVALDLSRWPARTAVLRQEAADPRRVPLSETQRIVAAGRGVVRSHTLDAAQHLADLLQAPLAASRPLVDLGEVPSERLVGQSGVSVSPALYLACGISGAAQHTVGMRGAGRIVAIDRDREAPIFGLADLKVVADLERLLPLLNARLNSEGEGDG